MVALHGGMSLLSWFTIIFNDQIIMEKDLKETKSFIKQNGYGSGTNFDTNLVAVLLSNYSSEKDQRIKELEEKYNKLKEVADAMAEDLEELQSFSGEGYDKALNKYKQLHEK